MAETLELVLLGNPEIRLAGQPLPRLRSAKTYALLYYLAVTRRTQPRTVLAGLFWGDVDEYYARRNFNRTLSDLAQFVGDHLLIERQAVAFAPQQPHWLDVAVLEKAATTHPTLQSVASLASAADLYRGDFLDGFYVQDAPEFEQWVLSERTRLRVSALHLHQALAEFYTARGDLAQAMDYTRRILQLEPWREEAHRQLMLLLAQSGQRSAALTQYERCRQVLAAELDVAPAAATLDLVARIRAGDFDKVTRRQDEGMTRWQDNKMSGEPPISAPVTATVIVAPVADKNVANNTAPSDLSPGHPVTRSSGHPIPPSLPHNLPGQRTPFVGRAAELVDITRLLLEEEDCRLLTLIGPGGMGKTRLALKAAEGIVATPTRQPRFADGLFFVPLENVGDEPGLVSAVIAALATESGFPHRVDVPLFDQLCQFLRTKSMLLVLDNFEHLVEHADLCSTLLMTAPHVKLLVTSRKALGLLEAWFYPLLGLSLPTGVQAHNPPQGEYDAVRLFVQCARRTRPDFTLDAEHAAVLRICTLVEGMPLALELAAAWLKGMTCEQIAQEVARGLDILTARYQNMPARHRSMRVVMDHTWALLTADEAEAIARLAVFRGRFRQEAAHAITGTSLFTLATLVEKALVRTTPDGYYQLHELTRQYAEEKLTTAAKSALRDAHACYYAGLLDQQKTVLYTAAYQQAWTIVGGELDNIRHAWEWLVAAVSAGRAALPVTSLLRQMGQVFADYYIFHTLTLAGQALFINASQVAEAAGWAMNADSSAGRHSPQATLVHLRLITGLFHFDRGHYRASLAIAEEAVTACRALALEEDLLLALLLYGRTQMRRGAFNEAITALQEALALAQQLGSTHSCVEALISLSLVANAQGRYTEAQSYLQQGLALAQEMDYRPWIARALTNLGTTYSRQHDYHQAKPYYEQALAIAQEAGDQTFVMITTSNLGGVYRGFGQYSVSVDYYQRSLATARRMGDERWIAANLNGLAITYLAMQELTAAERALREALTVGAQSDSTPDTLGSIALLGHLCAQRGQLDAALKALAFVEQHPATMARDHLYNQPLLAELRSELAPALFEQAAAWAAEQTLDDVVQWLQFGP
ncbi:MAG: BTAD domain-containing putative transcriptional regulator [Caldilineaceae bacterium]